MDIKRKVIAFLWIVTISAFVGMAGLDIIDDGMLNWSYYLLLGASIVTMVSSATIWFFTDECYICGKIVIRNDNYCKRCGADLVRKAALTPYEDEKIQSKSSQDLSSQSESLLEPRPLPLTRSTHTKKLSVTSGELKV